VDVAAPPARTVLVVEDQKAIRDLVCSHLDDEGLRTVPARSGTEALELAMTVRVDLILLDVMLPGVGGMEVCRQVRARGPNRDVPILMLTARREETQKVEGLESGADDYLTKPFGMRELVARVRALLRRNEMVSARVGVPGVGGQPALEAGDLAIDPATARVSVAGRDVALTVNEFNLLYVLATQRGVVLSRETLLARVWHDETFVTVRSVDTLVKRLRQKIEADPANPAIVLTVRGAGYKVADA
jgi:two-component system response regulator VicR